MIMDRDALPAELICPLFICILFTIQWFFIHLQINSIDTQSIQSRENKMTINVNMTTMTIHKKEKPIQKQRRRRDW